jgi:Ca2+-binding RTX toxin-like protein
MLSVSTGYGANNTITLGAGNQTVIAGIGADSIAGGTGNSLVIGDEGSVSYDSGAGRLTMVQTASPTFGAADVVRLGIGNSIILGGAGADSIAAGAGNDIVLGDNGSIAYAAGLLTIGSIRRRRPRAAMTRSRSAAGNQIVIGGVGHRYDYDGHRQQHGVRRRWKPDLHDGHTEPGAIELIQGSAVPM